MPKNNTTRQFYVVSAQEAPSRPEPFTSSERPAGLGLASAVIVSLAMWLALIWLGALVVRILSA